MQQYQVRAKTGQIGATFAVSLLSMQQYKVRAKTGQIGACCMLGRETANVAPI
jgi:alpha-D-ribose 1-methylphosphonate 5-triphosphate synthase subunit PhnG